MRMGIRPGYRREQERGIVINTKGTMVGKSQSEIRQEIIRLK